MLGKAAAMIAVKDLDRARKFYEETLGLETDAQWGEGVTMKSGDTVFNVYKSEFAGTNKATALNFDVDDIEKEVSELKSKGVFFEHYDLPGLEQRGEQESEQRDRDGRQQQRAAAAVPIREHG